MIPVWNQAGTDCPSDFVAQVQVETDCDIGGVKVTLGNPGTDTGAIFEIVLVIEGAKQTTEYELDADDTYILDFAIEDDSERFIEWQAKEISEEEFRFAASTTPRTIDCEEPLFTPIISTGFTCTTVGAVITVFVDNRISEIDSIVEIEINISFMIDVCFSLIFASIYLFSFILKAGKMIHFIKFDI